MPVCIYHTWDCLRAPVSTEDLLNDTVLSATSSLFLVGFCSSWVIPQQLLRKPLSCHCPQIDCWYSSCFLLFQPLITTLASFAVMPRAGSGPTSGCEESCLPNWSVISFPSIPMCTGTHTSWIPLCSAGFTRDWLQSLANFEFVWKMSRALMATWMSERIQMFLTV